MQPIRQSFFRQYLFGHQSANVFDRQSFVLYGIMFKEKVIEFQTSKKWSKFDRQ